MSTGIHKKIETFADRLRQARKAKAFGQADLADKIGVSKGSIGNWEIGPSQPRPETLGKLAALLEVTPAWLLYGDESGLRLSDQATKYRVDEGVRKGAADSDMRDKCLAHFEAFLELCDNQERIGWLWCELQEKFPLNKFRPSSKPLSEDELSAEALDLAEEQVLRSPPKPVVVLPNAQTGERASGVSSSPERQILPPKKAPK